MQLCLAHYCETHGPTAVMVTQGLPVECASCDDDDDESPSTQSTPDPASAPAAPARTCSSSSDKENIDGQREIGARELQGLGVKALQSAQNANQTNFGMRERGGGGLGRDASYRKTYDEKDKERASPCENCALTLPRKRGEEEKGKESAKLEGNSGPVLRTRKPYQRVTIVADEAGEASKFSRPSTGTSSSTEGSGQSSTHTHFLDYTSTHEPLDSKSYGKIRHTCLRTLSCETLPPSTTPSPVSAPSSPFLSSSSPSATSSSGGPIFFGDKNVGYTTAYIFRIPDPSARGRRRVYALMAVSTHPQRLAMTAFSFLDKAFKELAAWILQLAEMELARLDGGESPRGITPTSSFLSGGRRGGFGGMGYGEFGGVKSKGLAELVGLPDFFLELHARFVRVLVELGMVMGT